jgi:hypothetical protein
MSNILEAFGTSTSLTISSLNSLASSPTAGWQSAAIDNTSNLYLDYEVQAKFAAVNTAPAGSHAFFVYAAALLDDSGSDYATTGAASGGAPSGSEGTITFPDITTNPVNVPLIGTIPYVGQNAAIVSPPFSVAAAYNGHVPAKFVILIINHSGLTIAASGNFVKVRGVYRTVT